MTPDPDDDGYYPGSNWCWTSESDEPTRETIHVLAWDGELTAIQEADQ